MCPIFTAGEKIKLGFEYYNFAKELANNSKVELFLVKDKKNLAKFVKQNIQGNKIVIGMGAGSITAACFLQRHVENTPWAHLDIAGVTWLSNSTKTSPSGASGWGVKLLFDLTRNFDYKI